MHLQFADLPVDDLDRAKTFYVDKLGWSVIADVPLGESGWRWVELGLPGGQSHLHFVHRANGGPHPTEPVLALVDAELDAVITRLRGAGVEIVSGPEPAPWDPSKRSAAFRDSEHNIIAISNA